VSLRASLALSQPITPSRTNSPAKTAPWTLNGPGVLSQWLASGAPNSPWVSRLLGVPSMLAERNSKYMTDRNGHCSSSGRQPAYMLTPSAW